jgi:hypothetical protein
LTVLLFLDGFKLISGVVTEVFPREGG